MTHTPQNKLWLAAFRSQAKKCSPPIHAPADISAQRKFVIWLASEVLRDKFILLFRLYMDQKRGQRKF